MPSVRSSIALSIAVLTSCFNFSSSHSPAPLDGGETITYRSPGATLTLTFEKTASGFTLRTSSPGYPPEKLGPDLVAGRRPIDAFDLGMVWLPPELREVGSTTLLGRVIKESVTDKGRPTVVVSERNGATLRMFDVKTGFLLRLLRNRSATNASAEIWMERSTIPGL